MITFTIEADYVKDHSPKDLCHSCFHAVLYRNPTRMKWAFHPGESVVPPL